MTLSGSLSASVDGGDVEFTYEVRNDGSEPVALQFSDSQTHDVVVREDGAEVWRFSAGQMFMQMLQSETVAPGDALSYRATWEDAPAGDYEAAAFLAANGADATAETTFSV